MRKPELLKSKLVGLCGRIVPPLVAAMCGGICGVCHTSYGVFCWVLYVHDRTLGAAAHPSEKFAMSVRRHTKVLPDGEG